jgi:hypothetical protein
VVSGECGERRVAAIDVCVTARLTNDQAVDQVVDRVVDSFRIFAFSRAKIVHSRTAQRAHRSNNLVPWYPAHWGTINKHSSNQTERFEKQPAQQRNIELTGTLVANTKQAKQRLTTNNKHTTSTCTLLHTLHLLFITLGEVESTRRRYQACVPQVALLLSLCASQVWCVAQSKRTQRLIASGPRIQYERSQEKQLASTMADARLKKEMADCKKNEVRDTTHVYNECVAKVLLVRVYAINLSGDEPD